MTRENSGPSRGAASTVAPTGEVAAGHRVLVAGGTGNVGRHIVGALLARGAEVVVPSRSQARAAALREALPVAQHRRLTALVADVSQEADAARLRETASSLGAAPLTDVVASLGRWQSVPRLLDATKQQVAQVLEDYVLAHFALARTFLPGIAAGGGTFTMINGPSSERTWSGSGLVSVATAAQAMLIRAIAADLAGAPARIVDLVVEPAAYIGPGPTASDGGIDGAAVGRFVAGIVAGYVPVAGRVHLRSVAQLDGIP